MENIPLPTTVTVAPSNDPAIATVTIEPFYPGYGTTVGNALRRVLLSSLPGAAITAFRIKGVQHEFSSLSHVKEDFVEISLNLKRVRLKVFAAEAVRVRIDAQGERVVTAGDIEATSDVEIANPQQVIATLTDPAAHLEMELMVRAGRGYEPTEAREKEPLEVGMIALDALFSPIRKVGFQIENVRVGQMTNWDKLVLEIETDGTMTPRDAVQQANQYLIEHFNTLAEYLPLPSDATAAPAATVTSTPEVSAEPRPTAPIQPEPPAAAATPASEEPKPKRRTKKSAAAE